ncbi:GNAT family N-acetyltransferase [Myroides sp. DW712]|uniref:GNAT family N-acetyltransferase n=1 Tax=Myroides sp. DW712 TaxID=3389800 RepID=UPI00397AEDEE
MQIRKMKVEDATAIADLLTQMGYPDTAAFLPAKIERLNRLDQERLLVVELEGRIVAFISLHIIPQLAVQGDFMRISYFAVDTAVRSQGIGKTVEEYVSALARQMGCDRIELHSHHRRTKAHDFYFRQGYEEVSKYLVKYLKE